MNRISVLSKYERLEILEYLKASKAKIEDCVLLVHTGFLTGPETMTINVKCIYFKKHKAKYWITEMKANEFFTNTYFSFIDNIAWISYESIGGARGICKIDLRERDQESFYETLLFETNEYLEFAAKIFNPK